MAPKFRVNPNPQPASDTAERLFDDLPRTRDRIPSLWAHQADILRRYQDEHVETPDVALELPTGAGKTLPALLIAEWRRTALGHRVAYCAPNHQLAHQVATQAKRQGIDTATLVGSHRDWPTAEALKYDSGKALAITTYSTVFNSNPALTQPQTILFDDAHAAEQYVASAWSVPISRLTDHGLYQELLEVISPELAATISRRLLSSDPDPTARRDVRLLPASAVRRLATQIDRVLSSAVGSTRFRYAMIREQVDHCLFYISWSGFLIRPYIPPTRQHAIFASATQRIYISATLGEGGELERAFGRAPIERLPVPEGWERRGSGRRFFVFPELAAEVDPRSLTQSVIKGAKKALIIAPSDKRLKNSLQTLVPPSTQIFLKQDIEVTLEDFAEASEGVLGLANRYDGIDLPDDSCRLTVLDGAPIGDHLQERFFVGSLRAGRVLEERLRTRVIQGAGRCTRGLTDYSLVMVLGDDLTRFFSRQEVLKALRPEVQAEINFGLDNSIVSAEDMGAFIESFLAQDDNWQAEAEPVIAGLARAARTILPPGTDALATSVQEEVRAWEHAWSGDLETASRLAIDLCRHLTDDVLSSYRAFWLYLSSAWMMAAAEAASDDDKALNARALLRKAHGAAGVGTWLRETAPLPPADEELNQNDEFAVRKVIASNSRRLSGSRWTELADMLIGDLEGKDAAAYERGLTTLGKLLGAEASKPQGKGRADSVWIFGPEWWVTLEAKSEALASGIVSMDDVRQAATQLKSLAGDRGVPIPTGSVSLLITPKQIADPDAVHIAPPDLYLCSPEDMLGLARDAIDAWRQMRIRARDIPDIDLAPIMRQELREHRCLPTDLKERLTAKPIA